MDTGLLPVQSAQEITDQENESVRIKQEAEKAVEELTTSLTKDIMDKWEAAREAKVDIELQMLKNVRQKRGEYDPDKLAEIKSVEQPEIFLNVTDTKCHNGIAWIKDIIIQPGQRIFAVDPTPIPELPPEIKERITQGVIQQFLNMAVSQAQQTGQAIPSEMLRGFIVQQSEEIDKRVHDGVVKKAKELADDLADMIDDHFQEGGFYKALEQAVDDIVSIKNGFIKGPIFRKDRVRRTVRNPQTGQISRTIEERVVPQYDRRSPFALFPSPRSLGINDGYLFDVITIRPRQLHDLIGLEGYNETEIRAVLSEFRSGELKEDWLQLSYETREGMGDEKDSQETNSKSETIYCLELWDELHGWDLLEWGMTEEDIPDPDNDYPVCVWVIGKHIIKAMLNYDKLGRKPYSTTGFRTNNDSFWATPIPELIADCQQVCNACARNILSNVGFGSGPMIDLNVDRLEPNASRKIWPLRVFPTTDEQMGAGSKAVNFYQPTMVTDQLINVYHTFSKIADEHSGVPAWTHGDTAVGGAGNTSSGLNQLITQAARGIRSVVMNIDLDLIVPCLERHYDYILDNFEIYGLMGDYKVSAKGTAALIAKEQNAMRRTEFLNYTQNPVDVQLLGPENRRKMLFEVAKSLGIELNESPFPDIPINQLLAPPQPPPPNPETLDAAGSPVVGQETRQFNPSQLPGQVSTPGNPGSAIEGRAAGGPVNAGQPYVVGEQGPEVVVPQEDGTVFPNGMTMGQVRSTLMNNPYLRGRIGPMPGDGAQSAPPSAPLVPGYETGINVPPTPPSPPVSPPVAPVGRIGRPLTGTMQGTFSPEELAYLERMRRMRNIGR